MRYTDPNGEWIQYLIGAVVGAVANVAFNWKYIDNAGQFWSYAGLGATAGVLVTTGNNLAILTAGALVVGGNDALQQGFSKEFNNINWE